MMSILALVHMQQNLPLQWSIFATFLAHPVFYSVIYDLFVVFLVVRTDDFPSISDTRCSIRFSTLSWMAFSTFCNKKNNFTEAHCSI